MRTCRIPGTDLEVSVLCFGTGDFATRVKGAEGDRLVAAFVEAGGTFFDTAHCYSFWVPGGLGASERELAASLRRVGAWERAVVATKGGHPDGGKAYRRPDRYLAPEVISRDVEDSLERLETDRIPLYYLHRDDARAPVEEVMEALNREVARGRVGYLGASNWSVDRIAAANQAAARCGWRGFVISQPQWSLAVPTWQVGPDPTMRHATDEDARRLAEMGLAVAAYSSTAGGYFARGNAGFDSPENSARAGRARELAQRLGCTPTQVALAWLLHQEPVTIPILGTLNLAHLQEALGAPQVSLTPAQVAWLRTGAAES